MNFQSLVPKTATCHNSGPTFKGSRILKLSILRRNLCRHAREPARQIQPGSVMALFIVAKNAAVLVVLVVRKTIAQIKGLKMEDA